MDNSQKSDAETKAQKPILDLIQRNQIFCVEKSKEGFDLYEACDYFFGIKLTSQQLEQLGNELIALSKT